MNNRSFFRTIFFALGFILVASCSASPKNTDILEYGYNGTVKSVKSITYHDLEQKNDEWLIDEAKIGNIKTMTFNEKGNIIKARNTYPEYPEDIETTFFQFEDGRKSSFYTLNVNNDTIEKGVYKWISDSEYTYSSASISGRKIKSSSRLNTNSRDISGGYAFTERDSTLYSNSYVNTINKNNLITEIHFKNELTHEKNIFSMTYSDFDLQGNPLKVEMVDQKTGLLDNLSIREFHYYK